MALDRLRDSGLAAGSRVRGTTQPLVHGTTWLATRACTTAPVRRRYVPEE